MDDKKLWATVIGAIVVKVLLSGKMTIFRTVATAATGVFAAFVFTDPLISFLEWDPDRYRVAVAGMLALTGENLLRRVLDVSNSGNIIEELINPWRNKK